MTRVDWFEFRPAEYGDFEASMAMVGVCCGGEGESVGWDSGWSVVGGGG